MVLHYLLLAASLASASKAAALPRQIVLRPTVDLGYAKYQGVSVSPGIVQYLGIPYAAPPVGDLRWHAPEDPLTQSSLQDASGPSPICVGQTDLSFGAFSPPGTSEDCLTVDIYAPSTATPGDKLPVWVYLPGGGYALNANVGTNGTAVIETATDKTGSGIIFVYVNYRVGVFGFLASEKIRENGALNAGLLDQRKALEWVQRHVAEFGGDPGHVVLHGVSAGAGSVAHHLAAFGGRNDDLFQGVIVQSTFWPMLPPVIEVEYKFDQFVKNVSCDTASDVLACLRSKNTATLQSADISTQAPGAPGKQLWQFLPVVDGNFVQTQLYEAFNSGEVVNVPALIGNDVDEGVYFAPNASTSTEFLDFMKDNFPNLDEADLQSILAQYPLQPPANAHAAWFPAAAAAYGNAVLNCPGDLMASSLAKFLSDSVFDYRTNITDSANTAYGLGVPHTFESAAIFGPDNAGPGDNCSYETYNAAIVPVVMDYFVSFVKTLNPNPVKHADAPAWQPWGRSDGQRVRFETNNTQMETVPKTEVDVCRFWKGLQNDLKQ